jgi:hypothetical protein
MAQDRVQWRVPASTVMNVRVLKKKDGAFHDQLSELSVSQERPRSHNVYSVSEEAGISSSCVYFNFGTYLRNSIYKFSITETPGKRAQEHQSH